MHITQKQSTNPYNFQQIKKLTACLQQKASDINIEDTYEVFGDDIDTSWGFGSNENKFNNLILSSIENHWSNDPELPPIILKSLIATESAFNPRAVSKSGFVGLMQLGDQEATSRGLKLTPIDERTIPEKAIPVGLEVLSEKLDVIKNPNPNTEYGKLALEAYEQWGKPEGEQLWQFALAGYNGGGSTVLRAIAHAQKQGLNPLDWKVLTSPTPDGGRAPLHQAAIDTGFSTSKFHEMAAYPTKILNRVNQEILPLAGTTIAVDAGHGKNDPGAIGPTGLKEKDVALDVSNQLGKMLQLLGAEVKYTRPTDDSFLEPEERARQANRWDVDFFVSIHCNSFENPASNGTETFHHNNASSTSKKMAQAVQSELINATGLKNRGVKKANFAVLRATQMPAILVETAFISNPREEELLRDPEFLTLNARAISVGLEKALAEQQALSQEAIIAS